VNLNWHGLRAVVLQSDDWGLCAWSPDEQAFRVLADTPAFRSAPGARYGRSTLESADDVRQLRQLLVEFRGGDSFPQVWQANTIVSSPDYERLTPPLFQVDPLPLVDAPCTPSRWRRPGLWEEVDEAREAGVWWPELHGLHHLPETAWLDALRRGIADARRAHEQQSPICQAVEASGEYDPREPWEVRARNLELALEKFRALFGRQASSFCPPDYRWDDRLEVHAESLGLSTVQGKGEQVGPRLPKLRRLLRRYRWPDPAATRFYLPVRIAFEPGSVHRLPTVQMIEAVHRAARAAWGRGQPAVISTHRVNYARLDPERAKEGRTALADLLKRLAEDGARFLADQEVRALQERSWSLREVGSRGVLVRYFGAPREPVRFPARPGATGLVAREGHGLENVEGKVEGEEAVVRADVGEYLLEWTSP